MIYFILYLLSTYLGVWFFLRHMSIKEDFIRFDECKQIWVWLIICPIFWWLMLGLALSDCWSDDWFIQVTQKIFKKKSLRTKNEEN